MDSTPSPHTALHTHSDTLRARRLILHPALPPLTGSLTHSAPLQETLDRVLHVYAAGRRVHDALELLHGLYAHHALAPGPHAFGHLLRMALRVRHAPLARQLLKQAEAMGVELDDELYEVPLLIERHVADRAARRQRWAVAPPSQFAALPPGGGAGGRDRSVRALAE